MRFVNVFMVVVLSVVAVLHGREICFCDEVFDEACHTVHCLSCGACPSAAVSREGLSLKAADCNHLWVEDVDLCVDADGSSLGVFDGTLVWLEPSAIGGCLSSIDGLLPPSTAPPDPGGEYLIYRSRALLRS